MTKSKTKSLSIAPVPEEQVEGRAAKQVGAPPEMTELKRAIHEHKARRDREAKSFQDRYDEGFYRGLAVASRILQTYGQRHIGQMTHALEANFQTFCGQMAEIAQSGYDAPAESEAQESIAKRFAPGGGGDSILNLTQEIKAAVKPPEKATGDREAHA